MPVTGEDPDAEYVSAQFTPSEHLQLKLLKDRSTQIPIPASLLKSDKGSRELQFYKMNIELDETHPFFTCIT